MKVYIATALSNFQRANRWAAKLRDAGHEATSRWHVSVSQVANRTGWVPRDPASEAERALILKTNLNDLVASEVVLALTQDYDGRATYCEIGFAIALGMPVIWLQCDGMDRCIFDSDPLVTRTTDPARVLPELRRIEFSKQATIYDSTEEQ